MRRPRSCRSPTSATWIAFSMLAVSAVLFLKSWDAVTELGTTVRADRSLVDFVVAHRTEWLIDIARFATALGSAWVVVPVTAVAVAVLVAHRRFGAAGIMAASTVGTALAVSLVKALVDRPRPSIGGQLVTATGAAFPSGHAAQSVACYSALALMITMYTSSRAICVTAWFAAVAIALGVGWSRIYLGVHWPSDVVGGWSLAGAWLTSLVLRNILVSQASLCEPKL